MNEYQIAGYAWIGIIIFWYLAYILSWVVQWAWAWIDDSEIGKNNALIKKIASYMGYEETESRYSFNAYDHKSSGSSSDGVWQFHLFVLITGIIPLTIVLSINFYPVALSLVTLTIIAHIARFSRRHKKIFDEHVKDKSAHK